MGDILINTTDRQLADDLKSINIEGLTIHPRFFTRDSADIKHVIVNIWQFSVNHAGEVALGLFINWIYDKIKRNPQEKTVINGQTISAENIQINQIRQIIVQNYTVIQNSNNDKPSDPK